MIQLSKAGWWIVGIIALVIALSYLRQDNSPHLKVATSVSNDAKRTDTKKSDSAVPVVATQPLPPIIETITIAESDVGCLDKAITESAIKKPLRWEPKPEGGKGFYLLIADAFELSNIFSKRICEYWNVGEKGGVQKRDGDLVCLERLEGQRTGKCYWTAVGHPPSQRAGSMPSEEFKATIRKELNGCSQKRN